MQTDTQAELVDALLDGLGDPDPERRAEAEGQLRSLGRNAIGPMVGVIRASTVEEPGPSKDEILPWLPLVGVVALLGALAGLVPVSDCPPLALLLVAVLLGWLGCRALRGGSAAYARAVRLRDEAAERRKARAVAAWRYLSALTERRDLEHLADELQLRGRYLAAWCRWDVLLRLVPQLGPRDGHLINTRYEGAIRAALDPDQVGSHPDLAVVLLDGIERLGDVGWRPTVQAVIANVQPDPPRQRVIAAAGRCLGVLDERWQREEDTKRLLRPAGAPEAGATLLRPAAPVAETQPARLLRPIGGPSDAGTGGGVSPEG